MKLCAGVGNVIQVVTGSGSGVVIALAGIDFGKKLKNKK